MFKQDVHILIKIQKIVQLFIFAFPLFVSETEYNLNIKAIFFFFFFVSAIMHISSDSQTCWEKSHMDENCNFISDKT